MSRYNANFRVDTGYRAIPYCAFVHAGARQGPEPGTGMTTTTSDRVVLVADDEPYIGRIIQMKLEAGPYRVEVVHDGQAALERLRTDEPFDLVLMDIMMPFASGLDVLEAVREMPHRQDVPVIMLTAKGQDSDRERAEQYGATDFLTKPFSPKKLLARIDELFD